MGAPDERARAHDEEAMEYVPPVCRVSGRAGAGDDLQPADQMNTESKKPTPKELAIRKFNKRFKYSFPDGTGRSDCCDSETIELMARYAFRWGDFKLADELDCSISQ